MNVETAWMTLPRPPHRERVYARRYRDSHIDVALRVRPPGEEWEFVGWLANDILLQAFRDACAQALTPTERRVTEALNEGPDTPYNLSISSATGHSRVYRVVQLMLARRKVQIGPMFEARPSRHQRVKPLEVVQLAEAS
jgi:hypothetical protein